MQTKENTSQKQGQYGATTQILASMCHNCGFCHFTDEKPKSTFGKFMLWYRNWCPGWAAHTKVYGTQKANS